MAGSSIETPAFLDTVEGEISFFRSVMRARPIGMNQHFHVLTMRTSIHKDTGHWVAADELWQKLKSCYDIDALNAIDVEAEGYEMSLHNKSTPSTDDNLMTHPFFREEFSLPPEHSLESIASERRLNTIPSPPSSPEASAAASPAAMKVKPSRPKKRNEKSKASMAGLVGGESDSSDLTDSGEEDQAPSVVTATEDGGETVDGEEEDTEMQDVTVETSTTAKASRRKPTGKKATSTRVRSRPAKKRKR
ncbi:hypothetical protein BT96DRAFT_867439 [Gymnopus androsaceus JB14]|uniref:Chromatin modification-related protein EAF7 n=1 Tax=Gymnopus androsaceus JB14 TaxID=1447944 RepID=A0A6A4GNQ7_9AGAR|nr:hypothetical protein BT96DRAFT_867439 [Gymnopus androsaceus JB14]